MLPIHAGSAVTIASRSGLKRPGVAAITSFVRRYSVPPAKSPTRPPASVTSSAPGGDVPGAEARHPETVETPRGEMREVERAGAGAAHSGALAHQRVEHRQVSGELWALARRKHGPDQCLGDARARRCTRIGAPSALRAFAEDGSEELVVRRIEHDGMRDLVVFASAIETA